jgi:hypothetical protein
MATSTMFKYENKNGGSILEQLLSFIQPRFHDSVKARFKLLEPAIFIMYEALENMKTCEEELTKQKKKTCFCYPIQKKSTKNKEKSWEKRIFLTGEAAAFLLGRHDLIRESVQLLLCYNEEVYNIRNCMSFDYRVCIEGGPCNSFVRRYEVFSGHEELLIEMNIRETVEPKKSNLDDLNIFKDYTIFSEFIEITDPNNIKLYIRECECHYLNVKKQVGYPYPIIPSVITEVLDSNRFCECVEEMFENQEDWSKFPHKKGLDRGLNFLKSMCTECDYRTDIQKCVIELWRQYTYRIGSKVFREKKREFEKEQRKREN